MNGVRDLSRVLSDLHYDVEKAQKRQAEIAELRGSLPAPQEAEQRERLQADVAWFGDKSLAILAELVEFPPHHVRHAGLLEKFWESGTYERSVFIMIKFPADGPARRKKDEDLWRVINAVSAAVEAAGYVPRIATQRRHDLLWDNVELYLLGCARGIAIVEDKYLPELNPNVAMEWGWMRGMGKRVLYLAEQEFDRGRADLEGLLKDRFSWADPEPGIRRAVTKFLKDTE